MLVTAACVAQPPSPHAADVGVELRAQDPAPPSAPNLDGAEINLALAPAEDEREARAAAYDAALLNVAARQAVFADASDRVALTGRFAQGGVVFGRTDPGATVTLDGDPVMVSEKGEFVVGFGRDSPLTALLVVSFPDGETDRRSLTIEDREFKVERIDGLDQSKVSGFTQAQLDKIAVDRNKKDMARAATQAQADYLTGFDWPLRGRISGVFGSQRILNGEAMRPHSGLDIAAPQGTTIRAPAAGIVRLAETDMYFEGGLVFIDHGQWLESAFLHMSRVDVAPGQRIEKGDVIGAVGMTGRATGPHLHWSLKWKNRLVDPQLLLPAESEAAD
ncbi:MAG: peptidoglycan DD-metalloendopeptidase family protein [Alphaproteobacteria bacterium]|nr:peptidoglycan DD-metalloendopeptidase family protein [Alphaproteobacteria bacterium]